MPAGLVVPISGPYVGTFEAFPFGTLNDDGYELSFTVQGQEVNETDAYGMTLVEGIYRGQNWRCRLRGLEWFKTGLLTMMQMFGATAAAPNTNMAPILTNIGDRWTKYCQTLLLTAILGNPPSIPQTLTALNAGLAPQQQSLMNMTSKVREMPLEMVLIPYSTVISSVTYSVPFTTT